MMINFKFKAKPFAMREKQVNELFASLRMMKVDVETPVNEPASLLKRLKRIGLFLIKLTTSRNKTNNKKNLIFFVFKIEP